jgi:hypothetical protein
MCPLKTETPIDPAELRSFADRGRAEIGAMEIPVIRPGQGVVEQHGKIESTLLLEPSVLEGLDELPIRTALLAPFYIRQGGSTVRTGPREMIRCGAPEGSFERRNTAVRDEGTRVDDWERMYRPLEDRGIGACEWTNTQAATSFRLYRAPALREGGFIRNGQWRTRTLLEKARIPHVMVSTRYVREPKVLGGLSAAELRFLFALHAISDRAIYGGVDPSHVCVRDGRLTISEDVAERLCTADRLLGLLTEFERIDELRLVPAQLRALEFFPSSRPHIQYVGDDPESADLVVRLKRAVVWEPPS